MNASRSALVVGVPMYLICLIICAARSRKKLRNVVRIFVVGALVCVMLIPIWDNIELLIANYLTRGMNSSGRFSIWQHGVEMFKKNPLFGLGAFALGESLGYSTYVPFVPYMMHNTLVQMLAAYGVFGFSAYIYYRMATVVTFFKKPSIQKSMLGMALLSVLLASLLDNFVFQFIPMIYFSTCFAVAQTHVSCEKNRDDSTENAN